jgi:hypothetical protein
MAAATPSVLDARCPLCGELILSIGAGGRVTHGDLHVVAVAQRAGWQGYLLCDDCGRLAETPAPALLN